MNRCLEYVQFQGVGWISEKIKHFTRDFDSHSAVLDRERLGPDQLIEQWPHDGGIKSWMDYNDFNGHTKGTPYQVWSLEVSENIYNFTMDGYRDSAQIKRPYDWSGIVAFGFKGSDNAEETFCSEEMCTRFKMAMLLNGFSEWEHIKPETVHPGYWRNLLIAAGAKPTIKGVI